MAANTIPQSSANAGPNTQWVLRYVQCQCWMHWLGAAGFLVLLVTGLALLWSPLSFLAQGGWSTLLHRVGAVMFLLWPVLYALLKRDGLQEMLRESFTYTREDWEWLKRMPGYFLGHTAGLPPQGRINAGQKLHHAGTVFAFITIALSGLVLLFGKGSLGATGLALAAVVHDLSMLLLTVLFVGHVYFTLLYDALPSMLKGYVTREYAEMEHAKWLASLPQTEPYIISADRFQANRSAKNINPLVKPTREESSKEREE